MPSENPRSLDLAVLIVAISATCSAGFLMTRVGRLAALDQPVAAARVVRRRHHGCAVRRYVRLLPYSPAMDAAVSGWLAVLWVAASDLSVWLAIARQACRADLSIVARRATAEAMRTMRGGGRKC